MKQNLLVGLLVLTLAVNVTLGYELYSLNHASSAHAVAPVVFENVTVYPGQNTTAEGNLTLHPFYYKYGVLLKFPQKGEYLVGINGTVFPGEAILVQLEDGQSVLLNQNVTQGKVIVNDNVIHATIIISGLYSGSAPSPQLVLQDVGLFFQFLRPLQVVNSSSEGGQQEIQNVTHDFDHGSVSDNDLNSSSDNDLNSSATNSTINSNTTINQDNITNQNSTSQPHDDNVTLQSHNENDTGQGTSQGSDSSQNSNSSSNSSQNAHESSSGDSNSSDSSGSGSSSSGSGSSSSGQGDSGDSGSGSDSSSGSGSQDN